MSEQNTTPFLYDIRGVKAFTFSDKERAIRHYVDIMLRRTMSMFEYKNLPDTMPKWAVEVGLQINGCMVVIEKDDSLYCLSGNWGGEPDPYYIPTKFIVSNPYLNLFKTYDINDDCVFWKNDSIFNGNSVLYTKYAKLLTENVISLRIADINARVPAIIESQDDKSYAEAVKYLKDIEDGKLGVMAGNAFIKGLLTDQYGNSGKSSEHITDLIEYHQYLKASWFNDMGLQSNYNMKRESINSTEAQLNNDMLLPLIDDMFECRKENVERCNDFYGTNIQVEWASSWKDNVEELELEHEIMEESITEDEEESSNDAAGDDDANE